MNKGNGVAMTKRRREYRNIDEATDAEIEGLVEDMKLPRVFGQMLVGALVGFRDEPIRKHIHELYAQMDGAERGYRFRIAELEQKLRQRGGV
jgi:hypothetical protein